MMFTKFVYSVKGCQQDAVPVRSTTKYTEYKQRGVSQVRTLHTISKKQIIVIPS